jgi:hypothetical protein
VALPAEGLIRKIKGISYKTLYISDVILVKRIRCRISCGECKYTAFPILPKAYIADGPGCFHIEALNVRKKVCLTVVSALLSG